MKRWALFLPLILVTILLADSYPPGSGTVVSIAPGTATTGAGKTFFFSGPYNQFTWQVIVSGGTATAITTNFECSLDGGATYSTFDTSTSTTGETRSFTNKPALGCRCNIATYTTNGTTAACQLAAVNTAGGGGGGVAPAWGNILGTLSSQADLVTALNAPFVPGSFVLAQTCPPSATNCFATPANTQIAGDCTLVSGQPDINCTASHFVAGDVGKRVMGYQTCKTNQSGYANLFSTTAVTVATFVSATHITASANASASQATTACVIWGNLDDTATTALDTAASASVYCPVVILPATRLLWAVPHFFTANAACAFTGSTSGASYIEWGYTVMGYGAGPSGAYITNDFNFASASCSTGCFGNGPGMYWHDWSLEGGGLNQVEGGATYILINPNSAGGSFPYGLLDHFNCTNIGAKNANATGLAITSPTHVRATVIDGCGGLTFKVSGAGTLYTQGSGYEDGAGEAVNHAMTEVLTGGAIISFGGNAWAAGPLINNGGHENLLANVSSSVALAPGDTLNNANGSPGIDNSYLESGSACGSRFDGVSFGNTSGASTSNSAYNSSCTSTKSYLINSYFAGGSAGFAILQSGTGNVINAGGNQIGRGAVSAALISPGTSITGACTGTVPSASAGIGFYGMGPNITTTACASTVGLGVPAQWGGTVRLLYCTSSAGGLNASSGVCTALKNGAAQTLTCTIGTGTLCADSTIAHAFTFVNGDLLSCKITSQSSDTLANVNCQLHWFY